MNLPTHKVRDAISVNYLKANSNDIFALEKKLYLPVIDLELNYYSNPRTVYAGIKCRQLYKVADLTKCHYSHICHNPCHFRNRQMEEKLEIRVLRNARLSINRFSVVTLSVLI
jgi:hypothetical protein